MAFTKDPHKFNPPFPGAFFCKECGKQSAAEIHQEVEETGTESNQQPNQREDDNSDA